jgi:hypothetical protein
VRQRLVEQQQARLDVREVVHVHVADASTDRLQDGVLDGQPTEMRM